MKIKGVIAWHASGDVVLLQDQPSLGSERDGAVYHGRSVLQQQVRSGHGDHPIVWVRNEPRGERLFYSGMGYMAIWLHGHMDWIFKSLNLTRTMFKRAMEWTAGAADTGVKVTLERTGTGPARYLFPGLDGSRMYFISVDRD